MKKIIYLSLVLLSGFQATAQVMEVTKNWTSFVQTIDVSLLRNGVKFKLSASIKVVTDDPEGEAKLWVAVMDKEDKYLFSDFMKGREVKSKEWGVYTIENEVSQQAHRILVGGICDRNGKFFFDNYQLFIRDENHQYQKVRLDNASFEVNVSGNKVPSWTEGITGKSVERVKGYIISSSPDHVDGNLSLLIEGKNTTRDSTHILTPAKGYTPQIGTLVSMLNSMSLRVEQDVIALKPDELDHLMDDKANTIGALIFHLAAAEAIYQVMTFEHRDFNEEEKKKWQSALNLGDAARNEVKGHDVQYYIQMFREVRKKTLEELKKRNDEWLYEISMEGSDVNNYYGWFHMVEHQSSHLGQIRMVKKRLPAREQIPAEKLETDH